MSVFHSQRGFSMVENLVMTVLFAMISTALFSVFAAGTRNFSYGTKTVSLQTDLVGALNIFLDDVALTGFSGYTATSYNPSGMTLGTNPDGTTSLDVITPGTALAVTLNGGTNGDPPDSIQFLGDIASPSGISPDGRTDRITYQVSSGSLTRAIETGDTSGGFTGGTTTDTVAANVTGFQLRLFDKAHVNPLTANFQNTCYVAVTVYTADSNVKGGIPLAKSLSGETALRNFMSLSSCAG
jgi:type II secretory pathway component PulJ